MHQPWHSVFLVVASYVIVSSAQQPDCLSKLYDVVVTCFRDQGLSLQAHPGQQDPTTLMQETQAMDPAVQCQQVDQYKLAIACALQSLKDCLSQVGMAGALPDINKFKEGMDIVCDRLDELDSECMKRHYSNIMICGQQVMKRVVDNKEQPMKDIGQLLCTSADVNYDCSREHLKTCGKQTLEIYLEQLDKYQVPEACVSSPPGRANRAAYDVEGTGGSNSVSASLLFTIAVASLVSRCF